MRLRRGGKPSAGRSIIYPPRWLRIRSTIHVAMSFLFSECEGTAWDSTVHRQKRIGFFASLSQRVKTHENAEIIF